MSHERSMERLLRITEFWNWLPAFRAVAESEHLPTAAEGLRVSPSALSRTIRLLEENVGQELFVRSGRTIRLSRSGESFLNSVRDSMRRVHDGMVQLEDRTDAGEVHFTVAGPFNHTVGPVLAKLKQQYPKVLPYFHTFRPDENAGALLRGEIDVVFLPRPSLRDGLEAELVAELSHGLYCGRGHPLFRARKLTRERVLEHEFVAPIPSESGPIADGWPAGDERRIGAYVQYLDTATDLCARGLFLAVFPDVVVQAHARRTELRRLTVDVVPSAKLFALRRRRLVERDRVDLLIDIVRSSWLSRV
ncbi:MAG: LysR family transcriptional regulator [Planctomycetota bacterium]